MITHKNELTVPEVSCHSLQEVEGGYVIRYLVRNPEEVEWRAVKVFRPTEPVASEQEVKRSWQTPNRLRR
ncbi:MAG: hypothetical protein M3451_10295 [Chloroflexota bacterium]|jgi:hypothetical protein|nr:hypothetical protein [Chloroflexota bacterium]